jgi:hypothetical protein
MDEFKNTVAMLETRLSKVSSTSQQEVDAYKEKISSSER